MTIDYLYDDSPNEAPSRLELPLWTQRAPIMVKMGALGTLPKVPLVIGGVTVGRIVMTESPSFSGRNGYRGSAVFTYWIEPDPHFDLTDLLRVLGYAVRPEQGTDGQDRLSVESLDKSATTLLEPIIGDPAKVKALVVDLLRSARTSMEREDLICAGYERQAKQRERQHEVEIRAALTDAANAVVREARRGVAGARGRQQVTYAGGLRRAAAMIRPAP